MKQTGTAPGKAEMTTSLPFGLMLTMIGGMMDAYSFIMRGGVFATGQTGNLVVLAYGAAMRDPERFIRALVPIVSFWCGIFLAEHLLYSLYHGRWQRQGHIGWKRLILCAEAVLLLAVGFMPELTWDMAANAVISFSAAMQFCCFRSFGESSAYASVFCTGNMRSCAEMLYRGVVLRDNACLHRAGRYGGILLSFFTGVVIQALAGSVLQTRAIWLAAVLAAVCGSLVHRKFVNE